MRCGSLFSVTVMIFMIQGLGARPTSAEEPIVPRPLTLPEVLKMAERFSPDLHASSAEESVAHEGVRISQSLYFPTLDLTLIDSTGFPASANAPTGFNGLMGSPFRVGVSGGVYSTFTFFDLTREFGVQAAKYGVQAAQGQSEVTRLNVDLKTMALYVDAILNREQRDTWKGIETEINRLYKVIRKFVRQGQYSEVTEWLLKDQAEQAVQRQETFEQAYLAALRRLELLVNQPRESMRIEKAALLNEALKELQKGIPLESPLVTSPRFEAQTFRALVRQQSAQNWPRLLGIASAGAMQDTRLEPKENYSGWIGLTFPIFEGFRVSSQIRQARAEAERRDSLVDAARLELSDANARYTEEIGAREIEIRHYRLEKEYSLRALKLAEHRYVTFVGSLPDVRDSLYSYEASESGLNVAQVELYRSQLAQALINGGVIQSERP